MDDEFDDGLNDELLLKEIENFDNSIAPVSYNASNKVLIPMNVVNKLPSKDKLQPKQLSIFESFGINGPPAVVKNQVPKKMAEKNTMAKPAFASVKPSIVYEPIAAHNIDMEAFKIWIYPINYPIRDYQFNIVQKALFSNTLVALPTGDLLN